MTSIFATTWVCGSGYKHASFTSRFPNTTMFMCKYQEYVQHSLTIIGLLVIIITHWTQKMISEGSNHTSRLYQILSNTLALVWFDSNHTDCGGCNAVFGFRFVGLLSISSCLITWDPIWILESYFYC